MTRLVLALLVLVSGGCNGRPGQFPLDFDRMRDQPRYDPYERSRQFSDGQTMRQPPEGTVPVEAEYSVGVDGRRAANGRDAATIPVPITVERIERGRNRYDVFCRPCHDVDGSADSPVAKNMQLRQPPSLLESRIRQLSVGRIFETISVGYGLMPSYAHQLTVEERWDVVGYVRALQLRDRVEVAALPASMQAEAARALGSGGGR